MSGTRSPSVQLVSGSGQSLIPAAAAPPVPRPVLRVGPNAVLAVVAKPELWSIMTQEWPDYDRYQEKTDREIPVIVLEPRSETTSTDDGPNERSRG